MAKCISFEEAKKRREMLGRPRRHRSNVVPRRPNHPSVPTGAPKSPAAVSGAAGWPPMRDLHIGLRRMLTALFFPGKGRHTGPQAPFKGAGPLAS